MSYSPLTSLCTRGPVTLAISLLTLFPGGSASAQHVPASRPDQVEFWVPNTETNHILGFGAAAEGDVPPVRVIAGDSTGLDVPTSVTVDRHGAIYVANSGNNSVTVYAADASGNALPIRVVRGPSTGLAAPSALAVDAGGEIYVANWARNRVTVYPRGAHGEVWPVRSIWGSRAGVDHPSGIAVDDSGAVYVTSSIARRIDVFAPKADGNVTSARSIMPRRDALSLSGLALGRDGLIYTTTGDLGSAVMVFGLDVRGSVEPTRFISGPHSGFAIARAVILDRRGRIVVRHWGPGNQLSVTIHDSAASGDVPPVQTIVGPATGLLRPPRDSQPPLPLPPKGQPSVTVYPPGAAGDMPPGRTITGAQTLLVSPVTLAVRSDVRITVLSCQGRVTVYAADADGDAAPVRLPSGLALGPVGASGLVLGGGDTVFVSRGFFLSRRTGDVLIYGGRSPDESEPGRVVAGLQAASSGLARHPDGRLYRAMLGGLLSSWSGFEVIDLTSGDQQRIQKMVAAGDESGRTGSGLFTPGWFAFDSRGGLYVPNRDNAVRVYDAEPTQDLRPRRELAGRLTGLDDPTAVAIGPGDTLFVLNVGSSYSAPSVTVYSPGARGNAKPVRVLQGERTRMTAVNALAVDSAGTLYVLNNPQGREGCWPTSGYRTATGP